MIWKLIFSLRHELYLEKQLMPISVENICSISKVTGTDYKSMSSVQIDQLYRKIPLNQYLYYGKQYKNPPFQKTAIKDIEYLTFHRANS